MPSRISPRNLLARATSLATLCIAVGIAANRARPADLADNLAASTAGTERAAGERWLAAAFRTDAETTYRLSAVTVLLASPSAGSVELDLFTDGGLEPATFVATLTSPASFPTELQATTFTDVGIPLGANTTYWVVLRTLDGAFDWAWTTSETGGGVGFDATWDVSDDAGTAWYTHHVFPLQLRVTVSTTEPIADCDEDGVSDGDEIASGTALDCDANGIPDSCDIASGSAADCNANGTPDSCDLASASSQDCNTNGTPDECDVAGGDSADVNGNELPDECESGFLRGDANCDGASDISDSVWTLLHLFGGGTALCCSDSADVNDDGAVDIADPVRALDYTRRGGGGPSPASAATRGLPLLGA